MAEAASYNTDAPEARTMTTTTTTRTNTLVHFLLTAHPLSTDIAWYNYGTAGFRFPAESMDGLMVRVGVLSILLLVQQEPPPSTPSRSLSTGVMITASHNPECDNGVKLANPDGSMLEADQETWVTRWVNEPDPQQWSTFLHNEVDAFMVRQQQPGATKNWFLHVGRDTRSHSPKLSQLLVQGAQACIDLITAALAAASSNLSSSVSVAVRDHGVLTTPMLHHIVLHSNPRLLPSYIVPQPTREGYLDTYATAYVDLLHGLPVPYAERTAAGPKVLRVDCACGVGYQAVQELQRRIMEVDFKTATTTALLSVGRTIFDAQNGPTDGPLNVQCGSDHVKTLFQPPRWWGQQPAHDEPDEDDDKTESTTTTTTTTMSKTTTTSSEYPYCCALDGDADRIVFFGQQHHTTNEKKLAHLLDGDKIAILIAHVVQQKLKMAMAQQDTTGSIITLGMVQTAYANGAATAYVQDVLQLPVLITKTGVKHLHAAARHQFDIGIYFEANGHGTVVFSNKYEHFATRRAEEGDPFFVQLHKLINPAVGDALCDMLLVDYLLRSCASSSSPEATKSSDRGAGAGGWTLQEWDTHLYHDLPNRMLKVKVHDRSMIQCNANETLCVHPATVQPHLTHCMESYPRGRCFIRPSGTEDIVRVYAEAATRTDADALAHSAAQIVYDHCHGLGPRP